MDSKAWIVLMSVVIGALLGGVIQAAVARFAAFKEGKGIAAALHAEINGIIQLVKARQYPRVIDQIIDRLEGSAQADVRDYFSPIVSPFQCLQISGA